MTQGFAAEEAFGDFAYLGGGPEFSGGVLAAHFPALLFEDAGVGFAWVLAFEVISSQGAAVFLVGELEVEVGI